MSVSGFSVLHCLSLFSTAGIRGGLAEKEAMQYRPLGKTGLSVSVLGYGASPLGGTFGAIDTAVGTRCVRTALELGVNLIDVSPFYGATQAETVLGNALRDVPRDSFYLSTKVGRYGVQEFDFSPARVTRSIEESLSRLGVEYVDILLCHDIEFVPLRPIIEETIPALRQIVSAGKARFIGVSGLPLGIFPTVLDSTAIDVILSYCHYTIADTSLDTLLPYLTARNVGVINASPLGMGLLSGNPASLPEWHPASPAMRETYARAADYCREQGVNLADIAVSYSVQRPEIACTLVGTADPAEMQRNITAALCVPDPRLLQNIREILRPVRDQSWASGLPENQ
jgi:L-galactose dehydrogenase